MYQTSYRMNTRRRADKPRAKFSRIAAVIGLIAFLAASAWAGFAVNLDASRMDGRAPVQEGRA